MGTSEYDRGTIPGVSRLSTGALRMVDAKHSETVSMRLPPQLLDAWTIEAAIQDTSRTALFENLLLTYLYKKGWEIPGLPKIDV